MINKYKKKPVVIEAVQWTGNNYWEIEEFTQNNCHDKGTILDNFLSIWNTLEDQWINCPVGHFVIKGLKGEFYPCEPEVFYNSYELVE